MYRVQFLKNNRSKTPFEPKGIVLHETATPGATAEREYIYFNTAYRGASAHAFVDWDDVIQTIPYNEQAWHAGPTANRRYIGIEMCRPAARNEEAFQKVWNHTVSLFADLFREFDFGNVTCDNLLSHAEVSARWRETDHTDPVGYFAEYGRTVNDFRAAVQNELNGGNNMATINELANQINELNQRVNDLEHTMIYNYIDSNMPEWARPAIQKMVDKGYLKGNENGELNLTYDMLRLVVLLDRAGNFGG